MKKQILLIIAFLVMISNFYAQNLEPAQRRFNYKGSNVYLDQHSDFRALDTSFAFLWHWYNGKKMSKALGVNLIHFNNIDYYGYIVERPNVYVDSNNAPLINCSDSAYMIMNSQRFSHGCNDLYKPTYGLMMNYEPSISINRSDPEAFIPKMYDTTRPVFGFMNVKGIISLSQNDPNYNRMIYRQTDHIGDEIILSDPWPCNVLTARVPLNSVGEIDYTPDINIYTTPFKYPGYKASRVDTMQFAEDSGVNFYLSLNLRRIDTLDVQMNDDTILVVRMPYVLKDTSIRGYIRFDSIPKPNSSFPLPIGRGTALKLEINYDNFREFYITRRMLPPGNLPDKDITISAHFVCDNLIAKGNNPFLKDYPGAKKNEMIDSLKIEVESIDNNCDFAIDWIRIENRPARELYRGYWDSILVQKIQMDLDTLTNPTGVWVRRGLKPYRWYLVDEPSQVFMATHRYIQKLIGRVFTEEVGPPDKRFTHYINYHEKWNGMGKILSMRHMPWFIPGYMGGADSPWKYGGWSPCLMPPFPLTEAQRAVYLATSGYETDFNNMEGLRPPFTLWDTDDGQKVGVTESDMNNISFFERLKIATKTFGGWGYGTLLDQGMQEYDAVANPKTTSFLFDTLNWWGQVNLDGRYTIGSPNGWLQKLDGYRHLTGEELRFFINSFLLYGAKGLAVDGEAIDYNWGNLPINLHHGQDSINKWGMNNLPPLEFLLKDSIGGDFINYIDGTDPLRNRFQGDSISYYLGIDKNRIYVGRKSERLELFKTYTFVRRNEREIMNMRFEAGLTKGLRRYYIQNPKYHNENIFSKFIDTSENKRIRTRPLGRMKIDGATGRLVPYFEDDLIDTRFNWRVDSSFYYVTLLSNRFNPDMDSCFYLGVQNKRTGPHIFNRSGATMRDSVRFVSTAEVDELYMRNRDSGATLNWAKLGCREIRIPIKYTKSSKVDQATSLKIVELGLEDSVYQSNYWRQPDYTHLIDTTLASIDELVMRLLPGEGKILKVIPHYVTNGSGPDTCYGCEALRRHIEAKVSPVTCDNGFNVWNLSLKNNSDCDFDNLSFVISSGDNTIKNLYIDTSGTGYKVKQNWIDGTYLKSVEGSLGGGDSITFPMSLSSNYSLDYKIDWGYVVDGVFFKCDTALVSRHIVKISCDLIGVTVTDTGDSCLCGQEMIPSEKEITFFIPDSLPCIENISITQFLPNMNPPLTEGLSVSRDGVHVEEDNGSYLTFRFCPWEDWRVNLKFFSDSVLLCEKDLRSDPCLCDTIPKTPIWDRYHINSLTGYYFDFRNFLNCVTKYDVVEVAQNGNLIPIKTDVPIPTSGIIEEWFGDENYFKNYLVIGKKNICAPPCYSDTIKTRPTHWVNPAMIETKAVFFGDSLPCTAGLVATRSDMLPTHVFGITVFDGREPYDLLYSEMRNPHTSPPIDLRIPGGYNITNLVFPCDSALKLTVKYWDADTNCVAINDIDTTSGAGDNREYLESLVARPNPASQEITLDYEMKKGADVELEITDSQGNTKRKSIKAYRGKGKHNLTFQLDGLQSGVYYAVIRAESEAIATRVVVIK